MSAAGPVPTWLATGAQREAAIAARLAATGSPPVNSVVILEGMPTGLSPLADLADTSPMLQVLRIAPGCLHCSGNLVLRVTLNRVLRHPPAQLFIGLASAEHLELLRDFLQAAPYAALLDLQADPSA
ncbi:GTPase [Duganella qianjiadongensis]|uniref:GTPase n=1 Tax=Duganella qianjiadongensis TaxID=2692176 RepID=A0ABW9VJB6_9BURK|nr:GTPase [Duganella qianjiadongensis]